VTTKVKAIKVKIGAVEFCNTGPLAFIAGPCVIESEQNYLFTAKKTGGNFPRSESVLRAESVF